MKRQISLFMLFTLTLIFSPSFFASGGRKSESKSSENNFSLNESFGEESHGNESDGPDSGQAEPEKTEKEWAEIGEQGKKALSEAGKFFSEAGKKALSQTGKVLGETLSETGKVLSETMSEAGKSLSDAYSEATTPKCYGKWIYRNGKSRTVIECEEDGGMSVLRKNGGKTEKWSGVFTATGRTITFSITKKDGKRLEQNETWFFTYSLQEGGATIKFQCSNLFSSSVLFEKYHLFA